MECNATSTNGGFTDAAFFFQSLTISLRNVYHTYKYMRKLRTSPPLESLNAQFCTIVMITHRNLGDKIL